MPNIGPRQPPPDINLGSGFTWDIKDANLSAELLAVCGLRFL